MPAGAWARTRLRSVARRRGATVIFRTNSVLPGADPQPSPPTVAGGLTLAAPALAGATTLQLRANLLVGRIAAGDRLTIGTSVYTVTLGATATLNAATVTVTPAVGVGGHVSGAAVTPSWAADLSVRAMVLSNPESGPPGRPELDKPLTLSVPAISLPVRPKVGDIMIYDGDALAIADVSPEIVGETVVAYIVRAR